MESKWGEKPGNKSKFRRWERLYKEEMKKDSRTWIYEKGMGVTGRGGHSRAGVGEAVSGICSAMYIFYISVAYIVG